MLSVLSLFSGCGGMDLGLEGGFRCLPREVPSRWVADFGDGWVTVDRTGLRTAFACDIRPGAKAAWEGYLGSRGAYRLESVVDLVKRHRAGEAVFPKADIVTGGFPCCDFSVCGERRGFDSRKDHMGRPLAVNAPTVESRGALYMWMRDVITIAEPKLFIAENVKGLASLGDVKRVIERDFAGAGGGYLVVPARVLYAPDYGVPQSRERIIFFGLKKPALNKKALEELSKAVIAAPYDPYPPRTHGAGLMPYVTCADALAGLAEPEYSGDPDQRRYSRCRRTVGQGQSEVKLDSVGPTIRAEHHGNIEFRRLSEEHGGRHVHELAAGLPERRLTVRECARIQTFPDDYGFACVSASEAYRLIGNAVPPLLAYAIARNVEAKWDAWFGE